MEVFYDVIEKEEELNCGEKVIHTIEPITITIVLAEYRSLIKTNENMHCEINRLYDRINQLEQELKEREKV